MNPPLELDLPKLLARPEAYPWRPDSVDVIETHISWVFLAGDFVVKVKRPVDFEFVDHSTVELRRHSCDQEVRLNRRLTDDVYLGVVPITRQGSRVVVDGTGEPVEWATLMRRLRADGMLDQLILRGETPRDLTGRLANRLIPFHRIDAAECVGAGASDVDALLAVVTSNLQELEPFAGSVFPAAQLDLVDGAMRAFIDGSRALFERREREGFVRDGHGDLRAEHICLDRDRVQVFDCVEFNPAIRCADVASDLAFLLMDLERLGAGNTARDLEREYRDAGVDLPPSLIDLYSAHRALVRAKVNCLTLSPDHPELTERLTTEARDYLHLAMRRTGAARPVLILMSGLSGTGKSSVAAEIAAVLGAPTHASDAVRKALAGVHGSAAATWRSGIYDPSWTERTYDRLFELARAEISAGDPVVLDAAFLEDGQRRNAALLAEELGVPLILVETVCDEESVAERLARRVGSGSSLSDADLDVHRQQRAAWEASPPAVPPGATAVTVDTAQPVARWIELVIPALIDLRVIEPGIRDAK